MPPEVTVQRISFEPEVDRLFDAYRRGLPSVPSRSPRRRDSEACQSDENLEHSQRRAKRAVRHRVLELAPTSLVTFTTRKTYSLDDLASIWSHFVRLIRQICGEFEYVCVPEPHPSNPDHLHLHAAVRARVSRSNLRRCWHIALEAWDGRRVTATLRGSDAPGNIDDQPIKGRDVVRRIRKIGKYISKYITKDLIQRFNRRRYWPSKGIDLLAAQVFWLDSLNQADAIREACQMLGHWDEVAPRYRLFQPSERVAWYAVEPPAS